MQALRIWIADNIAMLMFLLFYFVTIVAGNILYATSIGHQLLASGGFPVNSLDFPTSFTPGYWVLLLSPLIIVPILVPILRPFAEKIIIPIVRAAPEFKRFDYFTLLAIFYGFTAWALYRTDALALASNTDDAISAINSRFNIQAQLNFWEKVIIHSILPALSIYSIVASITKKDRIWSVTAIFNIAAMSIILFAMNMKWPILVFYISVIVTIFIFSTRYAYIKALLGTVALVCAYLVISVHVFRFTPSDEPSESPSPQVAIEQTYSESHSPDKLVNQAASIEPNEIEKIREKWTPVSPQELHRDNELGGFRNSQESGNSLSEIGEKISSLTRTSAHNAPFLFSHAVNRMAISYPYYYSIFTNEGPVCGDLFAYVTPGHKPCHPSTLVYSRIFGADGFEGRGTAPAAPHITGYALGGWSVAALGLLGLCVVLAAFAAIPWRSSATAGTFTIIGATVGYHFSQIPGEGPIIYDHGFIWPILIASLYTATRFASAKLNKQETVGA